jgi:hypothetical protein
LFHPRGFALAFHKDEKGEVTGWSIIGNGGEVWAFNDSDDDEGFVRFKETMRLAQLDIGPNYL